MKNFIIPFRSIALLNLMCISFSLSAMVFDNRYFPLLQYPFLHKQDQSSHLTGDFFITTASHAADNLQRDIGIPELFGPFDQSQLALSFDTVGIPNPLPPILLDAQLPWDMQGKLQAQGFAVAYEQALPGGFAAGILGLAMRSNSSIDFYFNNSQASSLTHQFRESDLLELDEIRRHMLAELGLTCNHVQQGGLGDIETYLRWAQSCYYQYKLRSFNYGIRVGALIPTGVKKNINEPASVPFGGNGHWGAYASADGEFEIKEDWRLGFLLRGSKRFSKTRIERMPVGQEPQIFGVLVGPARVNPGFTQIFYAYGQWEGIREGLGLRLQYSLINHWPDHWTDERVVKVPAANLETVEKHSAWGSEYVTLTAFYDFAKEEAPRFCKPMVKVAWDIPVTLLVAHRFVKSYKVSVGLEFNF